MKLFVTLLLLLLAFDYEKSVVNSIIVTCPICTDDTNDSTDGSKPCNSVDDFKDVCDFCNKEVTPALANIFKVMDPLISPDQFKVGKNDRAECCNFKIPKRVVDSSGLDSVIKFSKNQIYGCCTEKLKIYFFQFFVNQNLFYQAFNNTRAWDNFLDGNGSNPKSLLCGTYSKTPPPERPEHQEQGNKTSNAETHLLKPPSFSRFNLLVITLTTATFYYIFRQSL